MLIVGAKGHAKEILGILNEKDISSNLRFFDNVSEDLPDKLFDIFPIIRNDIEVVELFKEFPSFVLGIGGIKNRLKFYHKMINYGGSPESVISGSAIVGNYGVVLGQGLNIMHKVFVSNDVTIGNGVLLNAGCSIHHDTCIGEFSEICPGVVIAGGVYVGNQTFVGAGAVILPKVKIGNNVVIGAGAIVTQNIEDNSVVVGIPAKKLDKK